VIRISQLLGRPVEDEAGERFGHVHDVRVRRAGDVYEVEGLVIGTRGMVVRLGLHKANDEEPLRAGDLVRWNDVAAVEDDRIVISSGRRPRREGDPAGPAGSR
jgi:sporulation protein YlmC with PRC-barrel domain